MKGGFFSGESVEWAGNGGKIFDITPVIPGEAQK